MSECGILVYATKADSQLSTVFLSTVNFTNTPTGGEPPVRSWIFGKPKSFVVFRMGGDGAILPPQQAGHTNLIGTFAPLCH